MRIVSLVLKLMPEHHEAVAAGVAAIPGTSVNHYADGKMIVLVEDADASGDGASDYAVSDSIIKVHQVAHVMSVTLAYEYSDEGLMAEEAHA